jgi:small subunit ribosomal protein S17
MDKTKNTKSKVFTGTVVSDKMKDTIVVSVARFEKHPKYEKYVMKHKKFKVHDAGNTAKVGDRVDIIETRPISKDKHFKLMAKS